MKSGRGGRGSWGGAKERAEGQPTKNRRDLSFPKPDPVWAPCHPKIHQNTTKKGKISPGVQTREREMRGREGGGKFQKGRHREGVTELFGG